MKCCVPRCKNSSTNSPCKPFFTFPSKAAQREAWKTALGIGDAECSTSYRVCWAHFQEEDYFTFPTKKRLKAGVVPQPVNFVNVAQQADVEVSEETLNHAEVEQDPLSLHVDSERASDTLSRDTIGARRRSRKRKPQIRTKPKQRMKFCIERFSDSDKKIFYYTGIQTYGILCALFHYVFSAKEGAVYQRSKKENMKKPPRKPHMLTPKNELFLTLVKLRRGYDYEELGDHFNISTSAATRVFTAWIGLLYRKLAGLSFFPARDVILAHAPEEFRRNYPDVIGSIYCTEFFIQKPLCLCKSQCFSHCKRTNTLKALVMIDPNGNVLFVSALFTGSISDKNIMIASNFVKCLEVKISNGELHVGDTILADEGFTVKEVLHNIGIGLNIPTFRITGIDDIEYIRKIAHERVHVERAIKRLRTFKVLDNRIPVVLFGQINEIFTVCALLTNFRFPLHKSYLP